MRRLTGTETVDDLDDYLATIATIASETWCTVQVFDARYVVDETHLRRALRLADRAFDRGENVAHDRGVEILLYAAGRRQIDRALEMGVSEGTTPVVALVAADETTVRETSDETTVRETSDETTVRETDDETAEDDRDPDTRERRAVDRLRERPSFEPGPVAPEPDRVRAFFDVTDRELAATDGELAEIVHERVALLDVEK